MQDYIVSARKYRPMTFGSVVGQDALTTTLRNAVKTRKLAHAYLFCGPRGVGKTTCARIFAKAINCYNPTPEGEACGECESCKAFDEGRSYNIFELDAASNNSVEDIRQLMEQTRIPPQIGRYKVFIIDEVHMLSQQAFNAFLKTLEEPPAHVIFILATTEKHKILPTILSRCQIYDFERMTVPEIVGHLKHVAEQENIKAEESALNVIAQKADGGMRDALSIFDQVASYSQGDITYAKTIEDLNVLDSENYFNIVDLALNNKVSDVMVLLNNIIDKGFDLSNLVSGLAVHIRNVMMAKDKQTLPLLEVSEEQRQRYGEQAVKCPNKFLYKALRILNRCDVEYKQSTNKRLLVELTLIEVAQITQPDDDSAGAGPCPKKLKSLFKNIVMNAQKKSTVQVADAHNDSDTPKLAAIPKSVVALQTEHQDKIVSESQPVGKAEKDIRKDSVLNQFGKFTSSYDNLKNKDYNSDQYADGIDQEELNKAGNVRFTQDNLDMQWLAMCNRMPEKMMALAQRMKNIKPIITDYPNIELVVENKILLEQIMAIENRIKLTLVKFLHNKDIQLNIRLARADEVKPILTGNELLRQMEKDNPAVAKLTSKLGLVIS